MSQTTSTAPTDAPLSHFSSSIAECYDTHLGPLLFEFSAEDLARRASASVQDGARVLEVACGTGIATEHLWRALPANTEIVATDLNPGMLACARARRGELPNVSYREADATSLPFPDESFDLVACQFGIMFFPDKARGLREIARVLKDGGRLVFNVWDSLAANPAVDVARATIAGFFADEPPRFLEVPFGYHAVDSIAKLVERSGFNPPSFEVITAKVEHDVMSAARGLVEGNPGVQEIRDRATADPQTVTAAVAAALETTYGTSRPEFDLTEIVFTAQKSA